MSSYRHISRIVAMQTLFEYTLRKNADAQKIIEYNHGIFADKLENTDFLTKLVSGVIEYRLEIDRKIEKYAPEWPIEKIALVERMILEVALFELLYTKDTPSAVIINEAVEISKTYGDDTSSKFINGVLSTANKKLKQK